MSALIRTRLAAGAVAIAGLALAFAVMAADRIIACGAYLGLFGTAVSTCALLALTHTFAKPSDPHASVSWRSLVPQVSALLVSTILFAAGMRLAVGGMLSVAITVWFVPLTFIAIVIALFRLGEALGAYALDEQSMHRPLSRRHGFWVVFAQTAYSLPMLGSFGLTDPWETHYGEVARELISRDDWISTWWAHEGWFHSKPILGFWMQALSMRFFGVDASPDHVLIGIGHHIAHPEWATRLPNFLLQTVCIYILYKGVARAWTRRAGLLAAIVLIAMPQWALLGHQAMPDMPLVSCLSAAMGLILFALCAKADATLRTYRITFGRASVQLSAMDIVTSIVLFTTLAQISYLFSRNVDLQLVAAPHGFRGHLDVFSAGSRGNCNLPGQLSCLTQRPVHNALQPALQALAWLTLTIVYLSFVHNERRVQRAAFLGAWAFAALSVMAKGPAGIALPAGTLLLYVIATRQWGVLTAIEIVPGLLAFAVMVLPWYVATYARHGNLFFNELVLTHMVGRTLNHLHDTNEGDDTSIRFYLWQLGYACFPWVGLAPLAFFSGKPIEETEQRNSPRLFMALWLLLAFGLFSTMLTKFHHYIFPAVPPIAVLIGVWLDKGIHSDDRLPTATLALAGAVMTATVGFDLIQNGATIGQARFLHLLAYQYRRAWPENIEYRPVLTATIVVCACFATAIAIARFRRVGATAFVLTSAVFSVWLLDVYLVKLAPHYGQRPVFDAYYRTRHSADEPIVAYQLNWKGENFYTGNHTALFVSSGPPMREYLSRLVRDGKRTVYFAAEHQRINSLRSEAATVGPISHFDVLTTQQESNKFALVRVDFGAPR